MAKSRAKPRKSKQWHEKEVHEKPLNMTKEGIFTAKDRKEGLVKMGKLPMGELWTAKDKQGLA